jgi:hypothetical protein
MPIVAALCTVVKSSTMSGKNNVGLIEEAAARRRQHTPECFGLPPPWALLAALNF